jgi:acetyl-CoA carboxylase biotin carboxyl carrier protein
MEVKDLKNLIKIVTETDITEFEMENSDQKIVIRRGNLGGMIQTVERVPAQPVTAPMAPAVSHPPAREVAPLPEAAPEQAAEPTGGEKIKSPMVGTFYRSPSPDSPHYVEVGDVVEKGQTLCIIEAMKLMNEIEAEYKCRIVEILKENAQPVEFGDILFVVEKI